MSRILIILFLLSSTLNAKELPDSITDERSLDEAMQVVERAKKEREAFQHKGPERGMASEEDYDPEFQKDFDEMMEDVDYTR